MNKLQIENLSIGYKKEVLVNGINFSLQSGDVCAILGKNGSGKSTLLKSILQFISPISGNILVEGKLLNQYSKQELSKKIAVVFSNNNLALPIQTLEFLQHGRYPYNKLQLRLQDTDNSIIQETIKNLKLEDVLAKNINELSDGNLKKVSIARAIIQDTPIIILDEPLSHLDISNQFMILEILQQLAVQNQKIIIYTSHDWNQSLQIANLLGMIKENSFKFGFTEDIALKEGLIPHLSNPNFSYDYCMNQYVKNNPGNRIKLNVVPKSASSDTLFWLYKTLGKLQIEISTQTQNTLIIKDKNYHLNLGGKETVSTTLQELSQNLQS